MRRLLLTLAVTSLAAGLAVSWARLQGALDNTGFLTGINVVTLVWFVCATAWAYRNRR